MSEATSPDEADLQAATDVELHRAVERALTEETDRFLDSHGGAVHVKHVRDGAVELVFEGACTACPAVAATFYSKVAPTVRAVPGVRSVMTSNVNVSEAAVQRILTISARPPRSYAS